MQAKTIVNSLVIIISLMLCSEAKASLINRYNFTLDTTTNIIEGNGLHWTRWDDVVGLSINQALDIYSAQGWRIATSSEMVSLFNVFISEFDWSDALDENTGHGETITVDRYHSLIDIFGVSFAAFGGISDILFGEDSDGDGAYRTVFAQYSDYDPVAGIGADNSRFTADYVDSQFSVQLVRAISVTSPNPIYLSVFVVLFLYLAKYKNRKIYQQT